MSETGIRIRPSAERGAAEHGWLSSRHSFSFGSYYDPRHMGFGSLRVINDDRVQPGQGFGTHPHRDMEIVSIVVEGALEHRDSLGNGSVIRPGDIQRMTAGTGVTHSEFNPSADDEVRFLQIWIEPERLGLEPGYEQRSFPFEERRNAWTLVASRSGRDGSVTVHQDVELHRALIEAGHELELAADPARHLWVQVIRGEAEVNGHRLVEGDGAALSGLDRLRVSGSAPTSDILVFDLA
ncbi:MAG TPA: pirin family protein [Candidatus Sulfomarinibacteraceae bacterium]|nr:pirin family protein [Candidatus Sulfomarinibacteraceae bacterium]